MVHIDMNGNGEYEFSPPETTIDVPGTFADGSIAVVGAEVTIPTGEASPPTLTTSTTDLGTFLVDGEGNALYIFVPDDQDDSTCYQACAEAWPPLVGDVAAGDGVDPMLIGSTIRDDGGAYRSPSEQVTYNGWPLYYFSGDGAPGDTNGQGVGGVWYLIDPEGNPIK
jgi:predicted lipoprotein with Yx(FWY)xxD motif